MSDIYRLAIRFADLWAVDHHEMVREIYSPAIHMESMTQLDRTPIEGADELHALEDGLAALIPEHRHELVRVIAEDRHACLETTVVGPTTGEYAPACVWWWLGEAGTVEREIGHFDWETRSTDSRRSHGFVPPNDHRPRFDPNLFAALTADPLGTIAQHLASEAVVEYVGRGRCDLDAFCFAAGEAQIHVDAIAADGGAIALLLRSLSRSTAVLTLGADDSIVSVRLYGAPTFEGGRR